MVRLILRYSHNIARIFTCTVLESLFNESVYWGPILYDIRSSHLIEILEIILGGDLKHLMLSPLCTRLLVHGYLRLCLFLTETTEYIALHYNCDWNVCC